MGNPRITNRCYPAIDAADGRDPYLAAAAIGPSSHRCRKGRWPDLRIWRRHVCLPHQKAARITLTSHQHHTHITLAPCARSAAGRSEHGLSAEAARAQPCAIRDCGSHQVSARWALGSRSSSDRSEGSTTSSAEPN
jgi:hypothetical protein